MKNKQIRKLLSVLLAATMAASASATVWGANSAPQDALPAATDVAAVSTMDKHGVTTDLVVKASSNEGIGYDIDGYRSRCLQCKLINKKSIQQNVYIVNILLYTKMEKRWIHEQYTVETALSPRKSAL